MRDEKGINIDALHRSSMPVGTPAYFGSYVFVEQPSTSLKSAMYPKPVQKYGGKRYPDLELNHCSKLTFIATKNQLSCLLQVLILVTDYSAFHVHFHVLNACICLLPPSTFSPANKNVKRKINKGLIKNK